MAGPRDDVIALLRRGAPLPSGVRVLAIDGRSGAGKTTFAAALAPDLDGRVLAVEHLYPGWDGLEAGVDRLAEWVLRPLAAGTPVRWRRYDWLRECYGRWRELAPAPVVVVEGVGAGARRCAPYLSALVWLEVPVAERRRQAMARDGARYAPHWDRWAAQEERHFAANDTAARADLVIRG